MEEADESDMDEFSTFGDEDVTDEAVGGILSAGRSFFHIRPQSRTGQIFMQGRSGSELNKAVNHGAKKQWSWAPSSRPNLKPTGGHAVPGQLKSFNKDVMEEADESGMDEFSTFGDEDVTDEAVGGILSTGRKFLHIRPQSRTGRRYSYLDEVDRN